jgi:6-pyruvoyltetrahydropterin/6-carboxytetrahydropterin synthase
MRISRKIEVDYGHTLPNHFSFCNQIHGHRAAVIATVEGKVNKQKGNSSEGMVFDFKILKKIMNEKICEVLDHGFAVWEKDHEDLAFIKKRNKRYLITSEPPTAEFLAKWAFEQIKESLPREIRIIKVEWHETPSCYATYAPKK